QLVGAVPYAQVCQDATGDIHAKSVSVGTTPVIDSAGKWVADPANVPGVKSVGTAAPLSGGPIIDTGTISLPKADAATSGYLSSTDWAAFDAKQNRVTGVCPAGTCAVSVDTSGTLISEAYAVGDISSILATAPLTGGGYSGDITLGLTKATAASDGYVSSADWSTFNAKQNLVTGTCNLGNSIRVINPDGSVECEADDNAGGTVTSVGTGTGLAGGPVTGSGTISLAASYADGSVHDGRFVNSAGDTMAGNLNLPADGLSVGADQLVCKDGFVGFGTASPMSKIDIRDGGLRVAQGLGSSFYFEPLSTGALGIGVDPANGNGVTVLNNGNVGVGTASPASPVEVYSSTGPGGYGHLSLVRDSSHDPSDQSWGFSVQGLNEASVNALLLQGSDGLVAPATNVMSWATSGNVGIGTTTPGAKLDVAGLILGDDISARGALGAKRYGGNVDLGDWDPSTVDTNIGGGNAFYLSFVTNQTGYPIPFGSLRGATRGASSNYEYSYQIFRGYGANDDLFFRSGRSDTTWGTWQKFSMVATSSLRFKENLKPIDSALDKVLALKGYYFDWKKEHGGKHDIGFVAEEVAKVLPEVVEYEPSDASPKYLRYEKIVPLLVEAAKEQKKENDSLKARLEALERTIAAREDTGVAREHLSLRSCVAPLQGPGATSAWLPFGTSIAGAGFGLLGFLALGAIIAARKRSGTMNDVPGRGGGSS
ncbi:MAG: tail fiber domain-containing protein, partial [Deltaproteobacteria bacterium]|nr:tail fiber domain-containing protein [Deltaproteobacteria bacterium]